jgi:hypothetical protein
LAEKYLYIKESTFEDLDVAISHLKMGDYLDLVPSEELLTVLILRSVAWNLERIQSTPLQLISVFAT